MTQRLADRLEEDLIEIDALAACADPESPLPGFVAVVTGRRSLVTGGNSIAISTQNYDYEYLCADLREPCEASWSLTPVSALEHLDRRPTA